MAAIKEPKKKYAQEEYLDQERKAVLKSEYILSGSNLSDASLIS